MRFSVLIAVVLLAACGGDDPGQTTSEHSGAVSAPEVKQPAFDFGLANWFTTNLYDAERRQAREIWTGEFEFNAELTLARFLLAIDATLLAKVKGTPPALRERELSRYKAWKAGNWASLKAKGKRDLRRFSGTFSIRSDGSFVWKAGPVTWDGTWLPSELPSSKSAGRSMHFLRIHRNSKPTRLADAGPHLLQAVDPETSWRHERDRRHRIVRVGSLVWRTRPRRGSARVSIYFKRKASTNGR